MVSRTTKLHESASFYYALPFEQELTLATATMSIDPTDKKYQVSEKFAPDKEGTWTHPKEKDGESGIAV